MGEAVGSSEPWIREPRVRHVPPQPRSELRRIYLNADVYVLPSLAEGFGLTALEAMACGLPVILSEHTFAHDIVTDGKEGYVVPIRDADAIAIGSKSSPGSRQTQGNGSRRTTSRRKLLVGAVSIAAGKDGTGTAPSVKAG